MSSSREEKKSTLSLQQIIEKYQPEVNKKFEEFKQLKETDASSRDNKAKKLAIILDVKKALDSPDQLHERDLFDKVNTALTKARLIPHIRDTKKTPSFFSKIETLARRKLSHGKESKTVQLLSKIRSDIIANFPEVAAYVKQEGPRR